MQSAMRTHSWLAGRVQNSFERKPTLLTMPCLFLLCIVACISKVTVLCQVTRGRHVRADFQIELHPDFVTDPVISLSVQAHTLLHGAASVD